MTPRLLLVDPSTIEACDERPEAGPADRSPERAAPARRLRIVAWDDPVVASGGVDALGTYVEVFWLPVLGPSATLLLRRLVLGLRARPGGYDLELDEAARSLGLGGVGGRRSPFRRAILRCTRYGVARHRGDGLLEVRQWLATLSEHHLRRLPPSLQVQHRRWETGTAASRSGTVTIERVRRRARVLALELAATDLERHSVERHLVDRGVHPAVAYESAVWAARSGSPSRRRHGDGDPPPTATPTRP